MSSKKESKRSIEKESKEEKQEQKTKRTRKDEHQEEKETKGLSLPTTVVASETKIQPPPRYPVSIINQNIAIGTLLNAVTEEDLKDIDAIVVCGAEFEQNAKLLALSKRPVLHLKWPRGLIREFSLHEIMSFLEFSGDGRVLFCDELAVDRACLAAIIAEAYLSKCTLEEARQTVSPLHPSIFIQEDNWDAAYELVDEGGFS